HELIPLDIEGWLTDECIARYVRARKGVYEDTRKALRKTIEWRAATRPHALRPDVVSVENETGKMYFNGFDKLSRPVIYMYNHRQNTKEADNQIRWVIYTLELCIRHMRPGVEKVSLAIDAAHWGFSNSVAIGTAKKFLEVLANHYPERLGRAVIFLPPKFFVAFYALVSPFIDPVTKAKVAFVNPNAPAAESQKQSENSSSPWIPVEDCFARESLEVDCYGKWAFQYSHPVYWKAI
ncbi:CRAL/TRIO domain-containing protein, partial [Martensiomyces pterosporus]